MAGPDGVLRHERGEIVSFVSGSGGWGAVGSAGAADDGAGTGALFARRWNRGDYEKDLCDLHKSILWGGDNQCFMIYVRRVGDGGASG